ncbi:MAG: hypothetical protein ACTSXK_05110 [Promethearchaeota archaeon]
MSQKEIDFKEAFKECFTVLGLINAHGLSLEMKQKVSVLIQTYQQTYKTLRTHTLLDAVPSHVKSLPEFQQGMNDWIEANGSERKQFDF